MDLLSVSAILSKLQNLKITVPSKRATFLSTYRQSQPWSLPDSLIYYITKNPSTPKCYEKIIQSCKHFFIKNPILILSSVEFEYADSKWNAWFHGKKCIDLEAITSKLWITETMEINSAEATLLPPVITKIYQSDIKKLMLYAPNQHISINDLKFIASNVQELLFDGTIVADENGNSVAIEKIIESFSCLKEFIYNITEDASKIVSSKSVPELLKIPHFSSFTRFHLFGISESFDIDAFYYGYIKNTKNTDINFEFCDEISDGYKVHLQAIVDEIVGNESHDFKVPLIYFPGITESSQDKLCKLYYGI